MRRIKKKPISIALALGVLLLTAFLLEEPFTGRLAVGPDTAGPVARP